MPTSQPGRPARNPTTRGVQPGHSDDVGIVAVSAQIDDENVRALVVRELVAQRAELVGLAQFAHDVVEGGVADEVAGAERLHRQPDRQVCLPDARRAQNQR